MEVLHTESALYAPILEATARGLEFFEAEDFKPLSGTILVVLPPKITEVGSVQLPETAHQERNFGRVVAVPEEDPHCPVGPGCWVVFRMGAPFLLEFKNRGDLALLSYCEGPESDLLGWFEEGKFVVDKSSESE